MASLRNTPKQDKARELRITIDNSLETLAQAVDEVRASETFKAYLDVQAKFHRYSWCNSLLIMSQCPSAERVAGYRTWQKLGRQVRKGERGIMIFAPCPWKRENESTGETESGMFFRCVHVFDVSQTDGEALPMVDVPTIDVANDGLLIALERVCVHRGIAIDSRKLDGEFGHATDKGKTIALESSHASGQRAKTLAHELAHCVLHFDKTTRPDGLNRNVAELEAESVAYVVCTHFGLDVEVRASRYIALWNGDSKALKTSLERIANTARGIIDDVDGLECGKAVA